MNAFDAVLSSPRAKLMNATLLMPFSNQPCSASLDSVSTISSCDTPSAYISQSHVQENVLVFVHTYWQWNFFFFSRIFFMHFSTYVCTSARFSTVRNRPVNTRMISGDSNCWDLLFSSVKWTTKKKKKKNPIAYSQKILLATNLQLYNNTNYTYTHTTQIVCACLYFTLSTLLLTILLDQGGIELPKWL